jgi:hypothetical protein
LPTKLAARVRAFGGSSGGKTDSADAHPAALAGVHARDLKVAPADDATTVARALAPSSQQQRQPIRPDVICIR